MPKCLIKFFLVFSKMFFQQLLAFQIKIHTLETDIKLEYLSD
jgi:hypothetical protein